MKVVIIEDEKPAAEKLKKALIEYNSSIEVVAMPGSLKESVEWVKQNEAPELMFMDIELSDGISFRLFEQCKIDCPVIFTTAYDDYWQEAFEHNSIDYLLKPIKQNKLEAALNKYGKLKQYFASNYQGLVEWQQNIANSKYKKRFLVKRGVDYVSLKTEDIAYFYAAHKLVCMVDAKSNKFILDRSLSDIEKEIDPSQFYRVNRKYLVNLNAIKRIKAHSKSKLLLEVAPLVSDEIIISQENVTAFKEWMAN